MRHRLTRMKQADPATLGREKADPMPVEKYETGSPSSWGEDVYEKNLAEGDKREETGHAAESKKDFGPGVKEAAIKKAKEIKAKAVKCVRIAEAILPGAKEAAIEDQGLDLMELSDRAIEATLKRLAEVEAEDEAKEESEEEVVKEARSLLAKVRGLIAEMKDEEAPMAEEAKEDCGDEAMEEMSEAEKKASVLVKKAKGIILAAEAEEEMGKEEEAEELKKEAREILASARKVLAGMEDLHPALKENAEKMKEEAGKEEEVEDLDAKKAAALRHLEAARKLMAELEAEAKEDAAPEEAAPEEAKEEAAPEAEEAKEEAAPEAAEEAPEAEAMEEDESEMGMEEEELAAELDMIPSEKDEALEDIFMNEDMKEAKEAYEMAFGGKYDEAKEEAEEAPMKTASKKGAKSLKAGIKISSVNSDDLSSLWDSPPDVSHLFK
jgi:hypothetical protein